MPYLPAQAIAQRKLLPPQKGSTEFVDRAFSDSHRERSFRLALRVNYTGGRSWCIRYRSGGRGSAWSRQTLGPFETMDNAQARRKAADIYKRVTEGGDPAREAKRETDTRLKRGKNVEWLIGEFIKRHAEPNCVESTTRAYKSFFSNWVIPAIGTRPCGSIKKGDLIEMFNAVADGDEKTWPGKEGNAKTAERVRIYCGVLFNWAASEDLVEHSPSVGIKQRAPKEERERVLSDSEIRAIWEAAGELGIYGQLVRFLFLTGQRSGRTSTVLRSELTLGESPIWLSPQNSEKNKSKRNHETPLSPQALDVLNKVFALADQEYVFPARRAQYRGNGGYTYEILDKPMSGWSKLKDKLDIACGCRSATEKDEDGKPQLLWNEDWRLHDIRRTLGTRLGDLNVPINIISRILDHKEGGVTKIYNRAQYMQRKRDALNAWGRRLDQIINPGSGDNVVALPTRAG